MIPLMLATAYAAPPALEGEVQPSYVHYDLEVLYHQRRFEEGLRAAQKRSMEKPADTDLAWTQARFIYEIAELLPRDDPALDGHYSEMLALASAALERAPDDPGLRFVRATAKARLGTTRGVLASLFMAKDIETDWLFVANHPTYRYASIEGVQALPCDAFYALGIFYRLVPDRWIVGVLAGTRGDLDTSLQFLNRAVSCKPEDIKNVKELAATQLCLGQKNKDDVLTVAGLATLDRALAMAPRSDRERIDHRHSAMLRAAPGLACGYSRDGQQDQDTATLEP